MDTRILGAIGGVALVLALLSPLVLGNSQKVAERFEAAETLYERSDYTAAIAKYKAALKEARKLGTKTERIHKDFKTLANLRIARCYYELAEDSSDIAHYQNALTHITRVAADAESVKHQEELTFLWAEIRHRTGDLAGAKSKFAELLQRFPNSRWVPKAFYTIGDIDYQQKNYDAARQTFEEFIERFPNSEFKAMAAQRIIEMEPPQITRSYENVPQRSDEPANPEPDATEPPAPDRERLPRNAYNAAQDLKQQGRIHEAYQSYTDLIAQFPESKYVTDAYLGKAEIHLEAKDYVNARANYEEAMYSTDGERRIEIYKKYQLTYLVPVYSDSGQVGKNQDDVLRFINATRLRKEHKFLEAAKLYEKLAERELSTEDTTEVLYWIGYCYHKAALADPNLFNKSVSAFKRLIENYNDGEHIIEAYYYLAAVYKDWAERSSNKTKWQSVIDTVASANTRYSGSTDVKHRGWLSRMQELKELALLTLKPPLAAADPTPKPEPTRSSKADFVAEGYKYLKEGDLEVAAQKARAALNINPGHQYAHQLLSEIQDTYYGRGWTFFDEKAYDKAIAAFKNALSIKAGFKKAHCHLGVIYIEQERYTEAIKALKKAIAIDPKFKEAHFNLALTYLRNGNFGLAKNAANTVLKVDPNYEPARMLLAFIAE